MNRHKFFFSAFSYSIDSCKERRKEQLTAGAGFKKKKSKVFIKKNKKRGSRT